MVVSTKDTGVEIKCKDKVLPLGQMVNDTKVNMQLTKKRAMACSTGLTDVNTMDSGRMANNMVRAFTTVLEESRKKVNGKKENGSPGSIEQKFNH